VYKGFEHDNQQRPYLADVYNNAISLGVMSKVYGLAGLRIGWTASRNQRINEILKRAKHYTTVCNSAPAEYLSILALQQGEAIIKRNLEIVDENMKLADEYFKFHGGLFEYIPLMGGTVAFVKISIRESIHLF